MLTRYALRNLKKRAFLNFIKVLGLSLGLIGVLFISLFLTNELTYDAFHSKADRIYRFTVTNPGFLNNTHFARVHNSAKIPDLAAYFPEIESYVRLAPIRGGAVVYNEKYYNINEAFICDSTFFDVFDANLLIGNAETILDDPGSLVLSQSFAQKVFDNENPVGKTISVPTGQFYGEQIDFIVKGIMKDFPQNSHFHPDFVTTSSTDIIDWWAFTYLLVHENADPNNIVKRYSEFDAFRNKNQENKQENTAFLQKLTNIHLHSHKLREIENNGNITNVYVLAIASLVILLISLSNFAGLNIGMAGFSHKFIQLNRILGSNKNANLKYYALESMYIILPSILVAVLIAIPANLLIQLHYGINLFKDHFLLAIFIITLYGLLGVLMGLQPALKQKIQGNFNKNNSLVPTNIFVSKGIIIMQYTLGIVLIVSVIIISQQTRFALNQSMGVKANNIICFESVHTNVQKKFNVLKAELLKHPGIESVTAMMEPPGGECNDMFRFELEGYDQSDDEIRNMVGVLPCDYSFATLFDLEFLSGENFSEKNIDVEGSGEYIVNGSALKRLQLSSPQEAVGKDFKLLFSAPGITLPEGKIIGVVKDFHLSTMKKQVVPLVLFKRDHVWLANFAVAYNPSMKEEALAHIKSVWGGMFSPYPFRYEPVDTVYSHVYQTEILQARLLAIFTFLALFISSIGLLGISLLVSQQKTKEIGIRKVNGAKILELIVFLNINFVKWICISIIIAIPLSWVAMNRWLESFTYRIGIAWWVFAISGMLALLIALATVSYQSWRTAKRNPVEALRYE